MVYGRLDNISFSVEHLEDWIDDSVAFLYMMEDSLTVSVFEDV